MAIGFINECQTSGLLNMNTNLLISSVVSLSAVHTDAFSTITIWLGCDKHFSNLYLAHVIEQPNFRIPNPQYFVYLVDQTVGQDILQFVY